MISTRAKRILEKRIHWLRLNVTTLHENDIERLERMFRYLIDNDMEYSVDDMDKWLRLHFMGLHQETRQHILDIAKQALDSQQETTQSQIVTRN